MAHAAGAVLLVDGDCGVCCWLVLRIAGRVDGLRVTTIQRTMGDPLLAGMTDELALESWHCCDGERRTSGAVAFSTLFEAAEQDDVQCLVQVRARAARQVDRRKGEVAERRLELVSGKRGTLRTELSFRRVKPRTPADHLMTLIAAVRRTQPKTRLVLVASCALILAVGIIGIALATQTEGDAPGPSAAKATAPIAPPAEVTVTDITVDELLDKLSSAGMGEIKVGDHFRVTAELPDSDSWGVGLLWTSRLI